VKCHPCHPCHQKFSYAVKRDPGRAALKFYLVVVGCQIFCASLFCELTHARQINYNVPDPTRVNPKTGKHDPAHPRLTWELVDKLRAEYRPHVLGYGQAALARKYQLARAVVRDVVLYRRWTRPRPPIDLWSVFGK